jgi:antitoxin ParD1/3/4
MNVVLKPDLEKFVREQVAAGHFADANAIINDALQAFREQEEFTPEYQAYLRREIALGIDDLENGRISELTAEQIIAEERARLKTRKGA